METFRRFASSARGPSSNQPPHQSTPSSHSSFQGGRRGFIRGRQRAGSAVWPRAEEAVQVAGGAQLRRDVVLLRRGDRPRQGRARTRIQHPRLPGKGPYIKDVRTEGGGGVGPKADIVKEVAWIYSYRSSQNSDKGGRGSKNPKILRTSFMYGPQHQLI